MYDYAARVQIDPVYSVVFLAKLVTSHMKML